MATRSTPTPSPSHSPLPVLALGVDCHSLVSRSVTTASCADDTPASSLPPIHPIPEEPRMDNATGTGTRVPADMQLVLYPTRFAVACRKNKAISTVLFCTVPIYCGSWLVGGGTFSSPAPGKATTVAIQVGTRCRTQPEKPALEPDKLYLHLRWHNRLVLRAVRTYSTCTSAPRPDLPRVS